MTNRDPFTAIALAILLTAGGIILASRLALAGGMPSDEGPEVLIEELGFDSGDSLDDDTIAAIIKSQIPRPPAEAYVPAAYVATVTVAEAPQTAHPSVTELPPALISPDDEWRRDHR